LVEQTVVRGLVSGAIQEFGRLDILVNSAGVARWQNVLDVTDEDWDWQYDVNAPASVPPPGRRLDVRSSSLSPYVLRR
jgi:NAD(P)-dependent dehydrogenase (short-subunit alcohol dehydrogenase family)